MDITTLLWGIVFGSIGLGYFMYGKRKESLTIRATGVALMVYPYFLGDNTYALVIVGVGLLFLPYLLQRFWN